jgi:hypothetical protein
MNEPIDAQSRSFVRRHLMIGWWGLVAFLTLGIVLETLHGFKVGAYLDKPNHNRRLMWSLAHAHGTLIALIHIGFSCSLNFLGAVSNRRLRLVSFLLLDAILFLPTGFFLGGFGHTETDPGQGVLLVPVGAACLLAAVVLIALSVSRQNSKHRQSA